MLIQITNGTYGHTPILPDGRKSRYVVPVNRKTGPIDVEPEEAARLVEAGVAEYVTDEPAKAAKAPEAPAEEPADEEPEAPAEEPVAEELEAPAEETVTGHLDGTDLESMTFAELKALAQDMGIETGKIKSKAAMIEAITAVEVEAPADEDLPELNAEDVVD